MLILNKYQVIGIPSKDAVDKHFFRGVIVQKFILGEFDTYELAIEYLQTLPNGEYQIVQICNSVNVKVRTETIIDISTDD